MRPALVSGGSKMRAGRESRASGARHGRPAHQVLREAGDARAHLAAVDDHVDLALGKQELGALEALGELFTGPSRSRPACGVRSRHSACRRSREAYSCDRWQDLPRRRTGDDLLDGADLGAGLRREDGLNLHEAVAALLADPGGSAPGSRFGLGALDGRMGDETTRSSLDLAGSRAGTG